jgi:hypothetical protein
MLQKNAMPSCLGKKSWLDRKTTVRYIERTGHGTWDKEGVGSRGTEEKEWENVFRM